MKYTLLLCAFALSLPGTMFGQGLVVKAEQNNTVSANARASHQANLYATMTNAAGNGDFLWGLFQKGNSGEKNYGEVMAGRLYSPVPDIQFGAGFGGEFVGHDSAMFRGMVQFWTGANGYSLLAIREISSEELGAVPGSGPWHKIVVKKQMTKNFALGAIDQSYKGRGPKADATFGRYNVWIAPTWSRFHDILSTRGTKVLLAFDASF